MYRAVYIGVRTHTRLAVSFLSPLSPVLKGNITRIQVVDILNRPFDARLLDNMLWRVFLLLFALGVSPTLAHVCYLGNEPDSSGKMRWVLPYRDPCSCSELRLGGVNKQAPRRPFTPVYLDSPIVTEDRQELMRLLNCKGTTSEPLVATTPAPPMRKLVCEHKFLSISCDSVEVIDVQWALYGREDGSTDCKGGNACGNETSSLHFVQTKCQGKLTCTIQATNGNYGSDPCQGVPKYLVVDYVCSPQ